MTEPTDPAAADNPRLAALERSLRNVADYYSDLIFLRDGATHYETALERYFPDLDWQRLLDLYADNPDDWKSIIPDYLAGVTADELAAEPADRAEEKPPLRCIGTAPDFFTGQPSPVYNREPEPGEALPLEDETKPVPDPQ